MYMGPRLLRRIALLFIGRSSQDDRRKGLGICGSGTGERCGRCGVFRNVCVRFVDGAIDVCDKVRLLDRTVMGMQMDETDLTGSYIDPNTAIQRGKIAGAQYVIQVTMQKPDVANVRTGIPLASIMGAFQAGFGKISEHNTCRMWRWRP